MNFLSGEEMDELLPAEEAAFPAPVPTQVVSSDEYFSTAQSAQQKEIEHRPIDMADSIAKKRGISRRRFFETASGMAASFVAMNAVSWRAVRRNAAGGADSGIGGTARESFGRTVHPRWTHSLPARRYQ